MRLALILPFWLCLGTSAVAACDTGQAPPVPVVKGLPYKDARSAILSAGWKPVQGHPSNDLSSNETSFRERGFIELQVCRLTEESPCRFEFASGAVALWINTTGDENPALEAQATVKSAVLGCVGDPPPQ